MAVVIVQQNVVNSGAGTADTYEATLGSDTVVGNQVFIVVVSDATVATPSGFTVDRSQVNNNGHYVFRKASVAETASWTVDPGGSSSTVIWVAEVSGLDLASGIDQTTSTGSGSDVTERSTGTTGTTDTADEWLLASIGISDNDQSALPLGIDSWDNSFVEEATGSTSKVADTNVGLEVALRTVSATATYETTGQLNDVSASTGIIVTYRIAGGTAFEETPIDPVGVTDDTTPVKDATQDLAEAVGVTDLTLRVHDAVRSVVESAGVTDDTAPVKSVAVEISDNVGVTDLVVDELTGGVQFLRPDSDLVVAGWTPTPSSPTTLFDKIDEVTASDTDYISEA